MRPEFPPIIVAVLAVACASPRPAAAPRPLAPSATSPESPPATTSPPAPAAPSAPALADASGGSASFEASVKPILVSSCMPCHFPGGKMYASLPFDDPATVASHSGGILRRIKDPENKKALEAWLATRE